MNWTGTEKPNPTTTGSAVTECNWEKSIGIAADEVSITNGCGFN